MNDMSIEFKLKIMYVWHDPRSYQSGEIMMLEEDIKEKDIEDECTIDTDDEDTAVSEILIMRMLKV